MALPAKAVQSNEGAEASVTCICHGQVGSAGSSVLPQHQACLYQVPPEKGKRPPGFLGQPVQGPHGCCNSNSSQLRVTAQSPIAPTALPAGPHRHLIPVRGCAEGARTLPSKPEGFSHWAGKRLFALRLRSTISSHGMPPLPPAWSHLPPAGRAHAQYTSFRRRFCHFPINTISSIQWMCPLDL